MSIAGILQKTTRIPMRIFAKIFFRLEDSCAIEPENIDGAFLIISNHASRIDPWIIGYFMPKNLFYKNKALRFMAFKRYMNIFGLGLFLKSWGAYPVEKYTGKPLNEILALTIQILQKEHPLVIFPEGRMKKIKPEDYRARPGIAYLAKETGLPILPALIKIEKRKFLPRKYKIKFGKVFYYKDIADVSGDLREDADKIMERVRKLSEEM